MLELGDAGPEGHRTVGRRAAGLVDRLVAVGEGARLIADGALEAGLPAARVERVADRSEALATLAAGSLPGDAILVKASRGAALDLLVAELVTVLGPGAPA
jgi:UDP-N-acetylmuramoyl-tripeptide--D-alanyl-D-alanine ligase